MNRMIRLAVSGLLLICVGCSSSIQIKESQTDIQLFEEGQRLYERSEYKKALEYFLYVKDHFLRSPYAGVTRFYAGESYFALKKYEDAVIEYKSFLSFFPSDAHAPVAQYKMGVSYYKQSLGPERDQSMLQKALTTLQEVRQRYPENQDNVAKTEEQIRKVTNKLALHEYLVAEFYRKEGLYASSNHRLDYLITNFPASRLTSDALFLQGRNSLDLGQPEDAKEAFLQFLQQYPQDESAAQARKYLARLGVTEFPQTSTERQTRQPSENNASSTPPVVQPAQAPTKGGYVVLIREENVFTDLIRADGIREGMLLDVYRENRKIGMIRIVEIHEGFSIGEVDSLTSGIHIQEEDSVVIPGE